MLQTKLIVASTFQIFLAAFLLSYFNVNVPPLPFDISGKLRALWPKSATAFSDSVITNDNLESEDSVVSEKLQLFTRHELKKFDGSDESSGVYLSILGRVYDVDKGSKHYRPGGGYHFFSGKDATKAFVTGDFTESGLTDDLEDLSQQDLIGIEDWIRFYDKEYILKGYLIGTYYDAKGAPTAKLQKAEKLFEEARNWKKSQQSDFERYPACNSEWSKGKGGRVWCSNRSGGVSRDWIGVPRKLFMPSTGQTRCACVKDYVKQSNKEISSRSSQGHLNDAHISLYDNCEPDSTSCDL